MHELPDIRLVERAIRGDREAVESVLTMVQPVLRAFFIRRIGLGPDVDDLVQNTLLRLHRGLADLNDASSLKSFAMKAALFELQDYYRGRYSTKELLYDPGAPPLHGTSGFSGEISHDTEVLLNSVSPHARRILELRAYGFKYEEIARMVDTTEAAVKMQVKRAVDRLRKLFAGLLIFWVWP